MRMKLWLTICVCLTFLCSTQLYAELAQPLKVPAYPQSLSMLPGEQTSFGFPLTKAGAVQAEVQWQGGMPLSVGLADSNGRFVAAINPAKSPARLTYNATAGDVAQGMLWKVVVVYPPNASRMAVNGTVSIRFPNIDPAQLSRLSQILNARKAPVADKAAAIAAHRTKVSRTLDELKQPATQRIAAYKSQADKQYAAALKNVPAAVPAPTTAATVIKPVDQLKPTVVSGPSALTNAKIIGLSRDFPTLTEAVPAKASPGERVILRGKNFKAQNSLYQADFIVRNSYVKYVSTNDPSRPVYVTTIPPLTLTAPVELITQLPNGLQEMLTRMPAPPAGEATNSYNGTVSVKSSDGNASNTIPFQYQAVAVPIINSIQPAPGLPGQQVTISGGQFLNTDKVHIVMNDGQDRIIPSSFVSTSAVRFTIPAYSSRYAFDARVHITRVVNNIQFASQEARLTLKGNEMDISSVNVREAAMDCPIVISGYGFEGKPSVTFTIAGRSYQAVASQASSGTIYVTVPKIGGISVNTPCQIKVTSGQKISKTALTFTYIPTYLHEVLAPCGAPFNTDIQFGETLTSMTASGGNGDGCFYGLWCNPNVDFIGVYAGHNTSQYIYFGKSGYDDYFPRTTLKNGWKLEKVVVSIDSRSRGTVGAYLAENGIGTSSARARVRWWGDAFGNIQYIASLFVTGPYGTSPF